MNGIVITQIVFMVSVFVLGFLIGRMLKQDAYEKKITNLEAEKSYWHEIACRKPIPDPPAL